MTVIRPNSISGISSITGNGGGIVFFNPNGINADVTVNNLTGKGTSGVKLPVGTTGQRVDTLGSLRFNSTQGFAEYYNGNQWVAIDVPPVVSSVSPTNFESSALPSNIVITGTNFRSAVSVKFVDKNGTETSAGSVTRNSVTQITAQIPNSITSANEPYKVKVTNTNSGLSGELANAFNIDAAPAFGVAAGSLGTLVSGGSASSLTTVTATDDEGDSITFSVTSGSVPGGITFNSNGTFSGNANQVSSSTTSTFIVTASDGTNTSTRQYTITVNPAFVQLSGSGTFSVPSGVNTAEILIVGGGGSGSRSSNVPGGGGGAGGVVYRASYTFTATDKSSGIAYSVGAGGLGVGMSSNGERYAGGGNQGSDTTFAISGGTITAKGGGYGAGYGGGSPTKPGFGASYYAPTQGGSGGGGAWESGTGASSNQGTFSGWTSYGNSGGNRYPSGETYATGGGGGAGGNGANSADGQTAGAGGVGQLFSSFTSYGESGYFGGGGAGGSNNSTVAQGGNGGGGDGGAVGSLSGQNGTAATGGGGGGAKNNGTDPNHKSGDGGSGTILLKY
jgi:hypothetical protein|tara:strand:+ start:561 stop:2243 length:1683 start_codon:yes stop_codon:yes gene_type:complete